MSALEQITYASFSPRQSYFSPKSALFSRMGPALLGESSKKLFEFSSPKGLGDLVRSSRLMMRGAKTANKRRGRNHSEDVVPAFSQTMYDRIDKFLDDEMLYIVSPTPTVHNKIVRASVKLVRFSTNPEIDMSRVGEEYDNSDSISLQSNMPSILARRTMSAGITKNAQTKFMKIMKIDSSPNLPFGSDLDEEDRN